MAGPKLSDQIDSIRLMLTLHGILLEKIIVELKRANPPSPPKLGDEIPLGSGDYDSSSTQEAL